MINTTYYQDLTKMNTFGMKVKARCFMEYDSVADLVDIEFEELARPVLHIGGGSNLLFTDDFKGTVLHSKINFIEILEEGSDVLVSVGSGVVFDDFCAWAAKEGLWGVENLSYIPGEVGASAVQNIGAYGVEVKDVIRTVYCYDTVEEEFVKFDVEECEYGYRDSVFKAPEVKGRYIVTHVVFALSRTPQPRLDYGHLRDAVMASSVSLSSDPRPATSSLTHPLAGGGMSLPSDTEEAMMSRLTPALIRKVIIKIRKEKLPEPSVMGSAGSFFKNPVITAEHFARIEAAAKAEYGPDYKVPHYDLPDGMVKVPAAWMIEQCGWKGRRSGGAAVYDKQPLVIVNYTGDAYPEEIVGLERRIIASVKAKFDIDLHPEVEHI
ncbi:MAG: UDP-N-acetylmuramate dehydrogenase [Bacteroidales bacterium]|nr:UDP-N-acetylmuramate dehydrogenase [Bacteroidales bacterium]